jgi:hypothetical protein
MTLKALCDFSLHLLLDAIAWFHNDSVEYTIAAMILLAMIVQGLQVAN